MEFFNPNSNVDFMRIRRVSMIVALFLVIGSITTLATRGLNFALDFTGGTLVEVQFDREMEQPQVLEALDAAGFEGAVVQRFGTDSFAIRLPPDAGGGAPEEAAAGPASGDEAESSLDARNAALAARVVEALDATGAESTVTRSEFVGPQVGEELAQDGLLAVLVVITGIVIYIAMRFEWKFGVATVVGELHDVLVTLGIFALTGRDFDLVVLAAVLAVDGYSVNDKIVVFDRVRELFRNTTNLDPVQVVNRAVNSTLSRTIMTSLTTLLTVVALFLFGGPTLENFALVIIIGIVIGTLSTIFLSAPLLLRLGVDKQDLMPKARDEAELARRP
ncbi:protein translocase subunit SecF [Coralloluteibacterium stylophorae]|uniref:Protein-export membrane protein SecF n=1 Tax=Coralloluteibacterium stylophorae TaxID=1776034 RepID=A0A8J7VR96_9GAMM|nr:protein translocase subunit SecF [Coralloluteibacterium stylophorae]MBS7456190.1 protein translocase subunit SecF [Coralloluteibacterium stylophorae]